MRLPETFVNAAPGLGSDRWSKNDVGMQNRADLPHDLSEISAVRVTSGIPQGPTRLEHTKDFPFANHNLANAQI